MLPQLSYSHVRILYRQGIPKTFFRKNISTLNAVPALQSKTLRKYSVISSLSPDFAFSYKFLQIRHWYLNSKVLYCSQKKDDETDGASSSGGDNGDSDGPPENEPAHQMYPKSQQMGALAPMTVPEVWPLVPVIAVSRNPVFPKFIKIV
ncbi:Lon protease-like protein, mitochondrial, partial [Stegodyphus mimosarum]